MGPSVGLTDLLHQLVDYVTENFYPEVIIDFIMGPKNCLIHDFVPSYNLFAYGIDLTILSVSQGSTM